MPYLRESQQMLAYWGRELAIVGAILVFLVPVYLYAKGKGSAAHIKFWTSSSSSSPRQEKKSAIATTATTTSSSRLGSNPPREWGQWVPLDFKRPTATPYAGWDVHSTKPLPYRPFRWGPQYHITMGISRMAWDEWIELDQRFLEMHALRAARLAERGTHVCRTAPEALPAAYELLDELAAYLPERYPSMFKHDNGRLHNMATGESFDVAARPLAEDPMALASRLVQDDLAIMLERGDGQYYLLAGAILLAGFWRLDDKFGLPLAAIHSAGSGVPGFQTKLKKGMENFFRRVTPDRPVVRLNYALQVDDALAWSSSIGSEDGLEEGSFGWFSAEKNRAVEHHHFRSERQTLRRLPKSGGVVFTIRTYFEKVTDIAKEPGVPGRLASAIRSWDDDVSRYKGKEAYGDIILEYLDKIDQEQKEKGIVSDDEKERESYPY